MHINEMFPNLSTDEMQAELDVADEIIRDQKNIISDLHDCIDDLMQSNNLKFEEHENTRVILSKANKSLAGIDKRRLNHKKRLDHEMDIFVAFLLKGKTQSDAARQANTCLYNEESKKGKKKPSDKTALNKFSIKNLSNSIIKTLVSSNKICDKVRCMVEKEVSSRK